MYSPGGSAVGGAGQYGPGKDGGTGAGVFSGPAGTFVPVSVAEALAMLGAALGYLNAADAAGLGTAAQAECLADLEQAEAMATAARARILAAFTAAEGYCADGQYGPKPWLRHVTRITRGAAAGAMGWARRLAVHPAVADALGAGEVSASWAREICGWSDTLPEDKRADADAILLGAAAGGAEFEDLAALAAEMYERSRAGGPDTGPDPDAGDGFDDRQVRLETTLGGAGRLEGDLTPGCAAALSAVLDSLGAKAGPEDVRTIGQRRHDALEEACHRLIAAGMLPERAGQPVQVQVHIPLSALRDTPGAGQAEAAWAAARTAAQAAGTGGPDGTCWLAGEEAEAAACDATIVPVVTGHPDPAALDRMAQILLSEHGSVEHSLADVTASAGISPADGDVGTAVREGATGPPPGEATGPPATTGTPGPGPIAAPEVTATPAGHPGSTDSLPAGTRWLLSQALLRLAADAVSGPGGLASCLRARLPGQVLTTVSLPLDVGEAGPAIPGHLRRAVTLRDGHCRFPGCAQPPSVCQVHHLIPRSGGGPTSLPGLALVCRFHHLTVIHKRGWKLAIHPDGTATATSPHGRVLHSHAPPGQAA